MNSEDKRAADLFRYYAESATAQYDHVMSTSPERGWIFLLTKSFWNAAYKAKEEGKKVILSAGCAPIELIYSFDAIPVYMDMIATRTSDDQELTAKYVDIAEKLVPNSMCGITKIPYGVVMAGDMTIKPDAMMYSSVPCDSSRISYVAISRYFGVPTFTLDVPFTNDTRGYQYMADQFKDAIPFLEEVTGNKFDPDKFREICERSNKAMDLLQQISSMRKLKPCPMPGMILYANWIVPAMAGTPELIEYLEQQLQFSKFLADAGMSAAAGPEKYRVFWMQNMFWANIKLLHWLEKKYGATVVMESFGYRKLPTIDDPDDIDKAFFNLAEKALAYPMIHGASGNVEKYIEVCEEIITEYEPDVAMFVGHVACKHTWAVAKIVKDLCMEKYGLPVLSLDVDSIDLRYKKPDEVKEVVGEFMDTLEQKKN